MTKKFRQLKYDDIIKLRNHLSKKQNGLCAICKCPLNNAVLDHHHVKRIGGTGLIRGVICSNCNIFLGKMENNAQRYNVNKRQLPLRLVQMANYLLSPQYPYIHPTESPSKKILSIQSYNKLITQHNKSKSRAKIPPYKYNKKGKPSQILTKPLEKWFQKYGIEPKFYKQR